MLALMSASSSVVADHAVLLFMEGGGFEKSIDATSASMYSGAGFRVVLTGRNDVFPPSFEFERFGGLLLFWFPFDDASDGFKNDEDVDVSIVSFKSVGVFEDVEAFGGLPLTGLVATTAPFLR